MSETHERQFARRIRNDGDLALAVTVTGTDDRAEAVIDALDDAIEEVYGDD
jgi:hypothetical protein